MSNIPAIDISRLSSVAVLGYGVTGESVVRFLLGHKLDVYVYDTRPPREVKDCPVDIQWQTNSWPGVKVDCAIVSPGLDMDACLLQSARASGVPLFSDIDLFFAAVHNPVIGITGTNGKSTVTSLVGHLLNSSGLSCGVGGNLGLAAMDLLDPQHDIYVLELSSFQLERSLHHPFVASTILNLTEDHLDKHAGMQAYAASKQRIYADAKQFVFNRADLLTVPELAEDADHAVSFGLDAPPRSQDWGIRLSAGERYVAKGEELLCPVSQLPLAGEHNEQNVLAACALTQQWIDLGDLVPALVSFEGLAHRFQQVATAEGVSYVNDSKATNLGATMAALVGMPAQNQVVLIAGGDAKGVDLTPLSSLFESRVHHLVALGKDASKLRELADNVGVTSELVDSMRAAVQAAKLASRAGDTVLLSPACASLDMFASYVDRGDQFVHAVLDLVDQSNSCERLQ